MPLIVPVICEERSDSAIQKTIQDHSMSVDANNKVALSPSR